ncbi:GAF and ANTAR domain-containing protein [Streptomyces sp. N2-109]|uniref:GAF and ANTAR domain-containing protein n=1 Tax=Streptomyces gossypii TaxID=2883101 RepID=A0ABT2JU66_9ACTN|nr:GAF and ANTAR domain-containing protein [Streptomyces gossypii]MCT2591437.1 GAF and ANTAR domain-containing protein [Streptomyces gossypii]
MIVEAERVRGDEERQRLAAVRNYRILDTPPDGTFERVAALAARSFHVQLATVTIVDEDRIWLAAAQGIHGISEIGRDPGLCASAILQGEPYVLTDTLKDARAVSNPLVRGELGLRFYAAAPLTTAEGHRLGTVNVMDTGPREVTQEETDTLRDLAAVVMDALELRLATLRVVRLEQDLRRDQEADLQAALKSHADIDQAIGMLTVTHHCDAAAARDILIRISQHTNTKLREIARAMADLAAGGDAPGISGAVRLAVTHAIAPRAAGGPVVSSRGRAGG